ncbi:MAG: DUF481 domain-containing protein [Bacteroidales bacterium]
MKLFFLIILLFCSYTYGHAQIMNIERLRLESDSGWTGTATGAYNINKSSKKVSQLQTNLHVQYHKDIHTYLMVSDLNLIKAGRENFENNGSQHFRYTRSMNNWMSLEGFSQFQYNRILKIRFRNLWGGGIRFEIFDQDHFKWYLGNMMMYEHEQYENEKKSNTLRLSYFINIMYQWEEHISLSSIVYIQPKMFDLPDLRVNWQSSLNFKVLDNLSIGIQYNWMTDSRPPEGVSKVIYSLRNKISYSF